ncbi:hypothetical protein [Flagellimonas sp. S3867]|uniref:hypothetical protein n=1 Tax=Flagellimonas sp. S3867 TaxID=2768063 RepID=UPI0016854DDD|nr:hypothetical protein [Flagellimonas sp. S3867]
MKRLDSFSVRELSKIIYQSNVMPSCHSGSFLKLSEHLIKQFHSGADLEKIGRIVSSELVSSYGLDISKNESEELSEDIYDWYHN